MMRRYGQPIPVVLLSLHVLSGFVWGAGPQINVDLLELGASTHQANLESLRTWSGRVMTTTFTGFVDGTEGDSTKAEAVAHVDFAYDRSRQASRWVWCSDIENSEIEGRRVQSSQNEKVRIVLRNGMIKDGDFFHSDTEMVTTVPHADAGRTSFWIDSVDAVDHQPMGWDFDPMNWFTAVGRSLPRRWRSIVEVAKEGVDLSYVTVTRDGNRVVLESRKQVGLNRTTIDLSQGGLLTAYDAESSGVTERWRYQNVEVRGVWVPKEITYETLYSSSGGTRKAFRKWAWLESRVNEPLGEDEFSLVKLGAERGDIVTDVRSGARTTLAGDEYPASNDAQPPPRGNKFLFLSAFSVLLVVLLGVALLMRRRRPVGDRQ